MSNINWDDAPEGATHYDNPYGYFCNKNGYWDYKINWVPDNEQTEWGTDRYTAKTVTSPIYTQAMRDNGELPPIGSEASYNTSSDGDVTCIVQRYELKPSLGELGDTGNYRVFIHFKNNCRLLCDIKPITPPIELIDGQCYKYEYFGPKFGYYNKDEDRLKSIQGGVYPKSVTNIKLLEVKS